MKLKKWAKQLAIAQAGLDPTDDFPVHQGSAFVILAAYRDKKGEVIVASLEHYCGDWTHRVNTPEGHHHGELPENWRDYLPKLPTKYLEIKPFESADDARSYVYDNGECLINLAQEEEEPLWDRHSIGIVRTHDDVYPVQSQHTDMVFNHENLAPIPFGWTSEWNSHYSGKEE